MRVFDHLFQVGAYARGALAFARVVKDPDRLEDVFQFIDHGITKNEELIAPVIAAFRATAEGTRAVRNLVRVGELDLDVLTQCPPGSLGATFAEHMRTNGLDPAALPVRPATTETEYVVAHLYETHDIWHVATGFGTDRAGELGLQAFYLAQAPTRVAMGILAIGSLNTLLFEFDDYVPRMEAIARGWELGRRARSLLGVDWAARWNEPLADVRRELAIEPARPVLTASARAASGGTLAVAGGYG